MSRFEQRGREPWPALASPDQGAELNWILVWANQTLLYMAERSDAKELVDWLRRQGAKAAKKST
jgi:hypothetical protein